MTRTLFALISLALALPATAEPYLFLGTGFMKGGGLQSEAYLSPGVGYQLTKHLAIEAAYFDTDSEASSYNQISGTQTIITDRKLDLRAFSLSVVGRTQLSEMFSLLGSASVYSLKGEMNSTDTLYTYTMPMPPPVNVGSASSSGSGTTYGLGIGVSVTPSPSIELRMKADWMAGKSGIFGTGQDLEDSIVWSISAGYRF